MLNTSAYLLKNFNVNVQFTCINRCNLSPDADIDPDAGGIRYGTCSGRGRRILTNKATNVQPV